MSGHSHWAGIKHKKGVADQKRGQAFSKLLAAISAAAKTEQNPEFNPRLRTAVEKAREAKVPAENIERAIKRGPEAGENLEELIFEAYGPGGVAILIEAISDNKNRIVQEIKKALSEFGGKWAESGSVRWAFEPNADDRGKWIAKFSQEIGAEDKKKLQALVETLNECEGVQNIYTNTSSL
ncbi:MAG: YebC/PmpR family DNA-binding transcriptional regulator [bacterium]|nr:YebC/PmpR family DNA-binding transcriptional regulator [bacterium]